MIEIDLDPAVEGINGYSIERLIALYLRDRTARTKAVTVGGYRQLLDRFTGWWADVGPWRNWELIPDTMLAYSVYLQTRHRTRFGQPLSVQGVADSLRRLRQLFAWAHRTRRLPIDISPWVIMPPKPRAPKAPIPLGALAAMLAAAAISPSPSATRPSSPSSPAPAAACRRPQAHRWQI